MTTSKHIKEMNKLPDWAGFIISSALAEFDGTNKKKIVEKVRGTAVGGFHNPDLQPEIWQKFLDAISLKEKYLFHKRARQLVKVPEAQSDYEAEK